MRFNGYTKHYKGMPSPIAQNERHITVLQKAFDKIRKPSRLGLSLSPKFKSYILISPNSRIIRPKRFDTSMIVKADLISDTITKHMNSFGVFNVMSSLSKLVSLETMTDIGQQLIAMHQPIHINYPVKFGLTPAPQSTVHTAAPEIAASEMTAPAKVTAAQSETMSCRHCQSHELTIEYGRYGYYFKCRLCSGNTPIKVQCENGHKARIRKSGRQFYRDCDPCATSTLYFENPT